MMATEISSESAPLKVGEEFVRYQVRALIGHGDHAYVYEAYDPFLEREVAIKIIPDPPNSQRDLVQRAMEQEAILRDLRHQNLVSVFEVGTIGDDLVYVVMERVQGQTLRQLLLERHLLTPLEAVAITAQVAEALAFAHSQMVIHRDLKPENIFILPGGAVKVINTGITSFIVPSGMVTERDRLRGTLLYMSPEHIQGFGVTDSCDMYSLGTVLYECLAGTPPVLIGSENLTLDDVVWRQVAHMPPQLDDLIAEFPTYLARTVQQMIAKEAVLRFASMDAVATRLHEVKRRIETGEADAPDSEPKKPAKGRSRLVAASDPSCTPAKAASIAKEISKRAAEFDAGVNSRCPPPMTEDAYPGGGMGHHRRGLLAAAVCFGSLVGLAIAIYRADVTRELPTRSPRVVTSARPMPSRLPTPVPADPGNSAAASRPAATNVAPPALESSVKSNSYSAGRRPPPPSASIAPQQMVKAPARARPKPPGSIDLIF